jgi:uncharacterized protein (TIGR02453 family)
MGNFKGFGPNALAFFTALEFHQDKAWFDENKPLYQGDVLDPMVALLGDLTETFAAKGIPLRADGKRSIFRIHRDVRFAKDKSPYKTNCGAVMSRTGTKMEPGLLYIHIGTGGCFVAAGFYMPEAPALAKLRQAIVAAPAKWAKVEAALAKGKLALDTDGRLTRIPRGFEAQKDGPLDGVIRLKSFLVREPLPEKAITGAKLADRIVDFAGRAEPLLAFGWSALD